MAMMFGTHFENYNKVTQSEIETTRDLVKDKEDDIVDSESHGEAMRDENE